MSHPLPFPKTEICPEPVAWLWPGYIPKGRLTVLDGDPGLGKSLTTIDLAARLTWPSAARALAPRRNRRPGQLLGGFPSVRLVFIWTDRAVMKWAGPRVFPWAGAAS